MRTLKFTSSRAARGLIIVVVVLAANAVSAVLCQGEDEAALNLVRVGFVVPTEWYDDLYVHATGDRLVREVWTDESNDLHVRVGSNGPDANPSLSGIDIELHLERDGNRIRRCSASGRWRSDFFSRRIPQKGRLTEIDGIVYVDDTREGQVLVRFALTGSREPRSPALVMGSVILDIP